MAAYKQRVSTDRFQRPFVLVGMKDKKGTGYPKGYVELKGQLYLVELSEAKSPKNPDVLSWVKITKVSARQNANM